MDDLNSEIHGSHGVPSEPDDTMGDTSPKCWSLEGVINWTLENYPIMENHLDFPYCLLELYTQGNVETYL